jgi:hypothetical protein
VLVRLAPASVCVVSGVPSSFTYQLSSLFSTIDIISMNDGIYYDMIQQRLQQAPLEIMFDKYYVFQNGLTNAAQSKRWAVSTQPLDWVIGTLMSADSRGANAPLLDTAANTSRTFKRDGSEVNESVYFYSSLQYPSYVPNVPEGSVLLSTLQNLNVIGDLVSGSDPAMNDFARWRSSFFAHQIYLFRYSDSVHRFNHLPGADDDLRLISGLNTMGNAGQGEWRTTAINGASGTYYPTMFVKTTRHSGNRQWPYIPN